MPERDERVYYVWRTHMEGTTDCHVLSFSEHDHDSVKTVGGPGDIAHFILREIRARPAGKSQKTNFVVKTISSPDMILRPRVFAGAYVNHSLVCRWPLSAEEMIKLFDLVYEQLRRA